jgi:GDP-mannose 6-dehydrogenase
MMRIAVFGLGYVGTVSAACLARDGWRVVGVDPQAAKTELINAGKTPIIEAYVGELIADAVGQGRLFAMSDAEQAVGMSDLALVCVGTPSRRNGSLDTSAVERVCEQIGGALRRRKQDRYTVVIRSTILPGTMRDVVAPALERASGLKVGRDIGLAHNPEFLREGSAVFDYDSPPKTVIGSSDEATAELLAGLYKRLDAPLIRTSMEVAELVKYADNAWHAVKIAFGNEIGNICKAVGVDSYAVMDIFCKDLKLNISPAYLKPGFAFGGSCLPKDLRAIARCGRELDLELPLLNSVLTSNAHQVDRAFEHIVELGVKKVSVLGVSFKAGTDDLRESPQIALVERLIGKGFDVRIHDRSVHLARLTGSNRQFILEVIPHISNILSDNLDEVAAHGEVVVIGNNAPEYRSLGPQLRDGQYVFDLARIDELSTRNGRYAGVNW